jgi:uncharacterized protein (TIGR02145 family)
MKKLTFLIPFVAVLLLSGCIKDLFNGADSGTYKDTRDNTTYDWIRIGKQVWMTQNLSWLPSVNLPVDTSKTEPRYYVYGYNGSSVTDAKESASYITYGVLYNWEAANNACPDGWHLPTDAEWTTLTDYLGGLDSAAKSMKSLTGWINNGNGDNTSGFDALPGGGLDHQYGFVAINYIGAFYSSSINSSTTAWYRGLSYLDDKVNRNAPEKTDGYSVRCIRD